MIRPLCAIAPEYSQAYTQGNLSVPLLPFPELGASVPFPVHFVFENCGNTVQTHPSGRRGLIVHGTAITDRPVFLDCADTLAYPCGQISILAHNDPLSFPEKGSIWPDNRPVRARSIAPLAWKEVSI